MSNEQNSSSLSVFMPAFNAAQHIPCVLNRFPSELWERTESFWVINDGSEDESDDIIEALRDQYPAIKRVTFPENRGYGSAVKEGLARCHADETDFIVCLHADGQYPPESIPEFLSAMETDKIDVLQGSRISSGTAISGGMPVYKLFAGKILTFLENKVFGLAMTDYHSGFIMYSRRALDTVPFRKLSHSFDIDIEFIASAHAKGLRVAELPIPTRYADEESHLNPIAYGFRVLGVMFKYLVGRYN